MNIVKHFDIFLIGFIAGLLFFVLTVGLLAFISIKKERRKLKKILEEIER